MVRRSAFHFLAAGALSMGALLPGCHAPVWPNSQSVTCERCQLPCSCLRCCGFSRCIDDKLARCAAHYDALKALESVPECLSSNPDYRLGFINAFQDVAIGHKGDLPAIPPKQYWNGCFRTGPMAQLAQDWFAGYCDGAEQARQCYGLNEVQVSAQGYPPPMLGPRGAPVPHGHSGGDFHAADYGHSAMGVGCPQCQGGQR
jgi:hypothetical protein